MRLPVGMWAKPRLSPSFSAAENGGSAGVRPKSRSSTYPPAIQVKRGRRVKVGLVPERSIGWRKSGIQNRERERDTWYRAIGCLLAVPSGLAPLAKLLSLRSFRSTEAWSGMLCPRRYGVLCPDRSCPQDINPEKRFRLIQGFKRFKIQRRIDL